jgi:WD40 repeat protein
MYETRSTDITTWSLPEGTSARLGRGRIRGGLTFSPDGDILASGGYDNTILLWDVKPYL